jgi:membrane-bound lytic murein transglycosylase B
VETDFGADTRMSTAGAIGPMQFLPGTFAEYDVPVPPGGADPPSPYDLVDAVYAATRLLCANGAASGADVPGALFSYNHSTAYVSEVLAYATAYAAATPATTTPATTYATTTPTISVPATSPASAAASATTPASAAAAGSVKSWCRERPVRKVERFSELEVRP